LCETSVRDLSSDIPGRSSDNDFGRSPKHKHSVN